MIRGTGIDSTVKLYLKGNGANLSTKFYDDSQSHNSVTAHGNAQISTTESYFGGSSMHFDGVSGTTTPDSRLSSPPIDFGTGPFSVYMWINTTQEEGKDYGSLISFGYSSSPVSGQIRIGHMHAGLSNFMIGYYDTAYVDLTSGFSLNDGIWHYICVVRDGTSLKGYVDGVIKINGTISASLALGSSITDTNVGYNAQNDRTHYNGYIQDLQVIKGCAIDGTKIPTRQRG
jgi:hypothetical protein